MSFLRGRKFMSRHQLENGVTLRPTRTRASDRFLAGLKPFDLVTFVSHVHPDPDSLGSMLGLAHLVETCLGKPTRLTRDGLISRAENRAMVELLGLDLVPVEDLPGSPARRWSWWTASRTPAGTPSTPTCPLYAVIDHHDTPGDLSGVPFVDVRHGPRRHLLAGDPLPDRAGGADPAGVATALLYGIETELSGYPREASPLDDSACTSCTRWPTRTCSPRSATPGCRRATSSACCRRCRVRSSTTG
jgi:nanoRNase/pAp phosphatase (c-di-AMP/oligoRNAs hydrolase)